MSNKVLQATVFSIAMSTTLTAFAENDTAKSEDIINGINFGPLAQLVGTWKSDNPGGVDVSPAQANTAQGEGAPAATPLYEVMTFEVAADATNASEQYLAAIYYKQEVFRQLDDTKFHDQRGYLIYDHKNQTVYNSFCVPRGTCVVAEGKAGNDMTLVASSEGIAQSNFMSEKASTKGFTMNIKIDGNKLTYTETVKLDIYGKPFSHTDSDTLVRQAQ
ncbi:heme-binding beta-barrel domain-containing protein [Enterovibrio norvegicus]|uniref:Heme-binding beta-barrel domain-containing protein n=1 Tax=Enterovibrio norvegicus TaxID=188144 RepID=A0ABV4KXQ9_9GAMM|nr:heme-binding beta-barrel domain-containing protein [Enterovibrio norvegicus]OEF58413.1 hypothetical protein A1OU_09515 [Enterovibrio norvegicus]